MVDIKRSLKDYGLQILRELLSPGNKKEEASDLPHPGASLEDLQLDDLRREKIRLEQEERKMLARLKEVEKQKRQMFDEGVRNASEREQRVVARRIKELDVEASNMDRMLQIISKQMRTINGLVQLKERVRMSSESGLSKILQGIDLQDLLVYVDKASVDGEFHMDKFDEMLNALEEADSISPEYREDKDVLDIMKAMQQAREAADNPEALDARYNEFSRQMEEKKGVQESQETEGI
ncbi:MAG: hypothetical protein WCI88_08515 [Chloroflexota bacterium]